MGNKLCTECMDCIYTEEVIEKDSTTNVDFCGHPFCNINLNKLKNNSLLVKFNNIIYCSSNCRKEHKKMGYIGIGWNSQSISL